MKVLVCLLATVCACNATLLTLLQGLAGSSIAGSSESSYPISDHDSHDSHEHLHSISHDAPQYHSHSHVSSPKVIRVIILHGGNGGGRSSYGYPYSNGYGSSVSYGGAGGGGIGSSSQVFKVITQNSYGAGIDPLTPSAASYGSGYRPRVSNNYNFPLYEILPQILQLILEGDSNYDYTNQLINHYGRSGSGVINRSNGQNDNFYSSGHVVQSGELKLKRLEETPDCPEHGHGD